MKYTYQFPEKDAFRAMEATKADFDITKINSWEQQLYVSLTEARGNYTFSAIEQHLGYFRGRYQQAGEVSKILFSGHKGSGKTTELLQFAELIESKKHYVVVKILLERLHDLSQLSAEEVFMLCMGQLYFTLQSLQDEWTNNLPKEILQPFEDLAKILGKEEEISKIIANETKGGIESSAGAKASLWSFFNIESKLSGNFIHSDKTTKTIHQKVRDHLPDFIDKANIALNRLRAYLATQKLPSEILFVIDGFEKTNAALYEHIFMRDTRFISQLQASVICCVPIQMYYDVQKSPVGTSFEYYYLPMLRANERTTALLSDIVHRRADANLFDDDVLPYLASFSGGSPRQMLTLVHQSIVVSLGSKVTKKDAEKAVNKFGIELFRVLTRIHQDIIKKEDYLNADSDTLDLMFKGVLLEYNGDNLERYLNPVLRKHFPELSA